MMLRDLLWSAPVVGAIASATATAEFQWADIEPTADLRYHACYDGYQCARLKVPLDWLDPNNTATAAIAITVLPATVPVTDPSFAGTILSNPGGPGGSGVNFVQRLGPHLQKIIDRPAGGAKPERHYEILSFDPRGVANTVPRIDCLEGDPIARDSLELMARDMGNLDVSPDALRRNYAMYQALGSLCDRNAREALPFVTTASVARDMVEIVDRVEELRKKEKAEARRSIGGEEAQRPLGREAAEGGDVARIQYIGFSYGTILGNAFASMFPGRVGRVIVDGVDDITDYMKTVSPLMYLHWFRLSPALCQS